jgi:hypothetical protein
VDLNPALYFAWDLFSSPISYPWYKRHLYPKEFCYISLCDYEHTHIYLYAHEHTHNYSLVPYLVHLAYCSFCCCCCCFWYHQFIRFVCYKMMFF